MRQYGRVHGTGSLCARCGHESKGNSANEDQSPHGPTFGVGGLLHQSSDMWPPSRAVHKQPPVDRDEGLFG